MSARTTRFLLARVDPRAAAFVMRLAKLEAWPSLDATLAAGAVVAILIAFLHIFGADAVLLALIWIELLALLIMPFVCMVMAASLAVRDRQNEEFKLLQLTNLDGRVVFQGYFLATLYRLRVPLVLILGGLPQISTRLIADHWVWGSVAVLISVGVWGMNLVGASIGADPAFQHISLAAAILIAMFLFGVLYYVMGTVSIYVGMFAGMIAELLIRGLVVTSQLACAILPGAMMFCAFPYLTTRIYLLKQRSLP